jgi:hypothetical protein
MTRDLLGFSHYRYRLVDSRNLLREWRHQLGPKRLSAMAQCGFVRSVTVGLIARWLGLARVDHLQPDTGEFQNVNRER